MPRNQRIHTVSAYHVMLRGNNGGTLFFSPKDNIHFCLLIQQGTEQFDHKIHGFCLMKNHVHLVVETNQVSLSRIILHLASRYARYINFTYHRTGHVFQGRFKSIRVDAENYLLELIRYVHLNSVRAKITSLPEEYLWSKHRTYLGLNEITWLTQHWVLKKFHHQEEQAKKCYEDYVNQGKGKPLSNELFLDWQGSLIQTIQDQLLDVQVETKATHIIQPTFNLKILPEDIIDSVCLELNITPLCLQSVEKKSSLSQARGLITLITQNNGYLSLKELGLILNKNPNYLSRLGSETKLKINSSSELKEIFDRVNARINAKINTRIELEC